MVRPYHERERIGPSWALRLKFRNAQWWWYRPYNQQITTENTPVRQSALRMIHNKWVKFRVHKVSEKHMVMVLCTYTNLSFFEILTLVEVMTWPRTTWSHVGEKVWPHTLDNKYSCIGERAVYDKLEASIEESLERFLPDESPNR